MKQNRFFNCEFRALETEQGVVLEGRPVVYNSRTNIGGFFDEIIMPGALDSCDLRDVLFFVNHDFSKIPLARSRNNNENSTMRLSVDAEGMMIRATLDVDNNDTARALYSAVKRGDLSGMSFAFRLSEGCDTWENMDSDTPLRKIHKIDSVVEVSACNFPAYEDTYINARSASDDAMKALESARNKTLESVQLQLMKEKALALSKN